MGRKKHRGLRQVSEMIKRAHDEFGRPSEPYSSPILPPPTEEAIREECRAGVVKQARARQELRFQNMKESRGQVSNLDDYPALNRLASTMSQNRISVSRTEKGVSLVAGSVGC